MLGEGAIDIQGILETIESTGFSGFVTVELYTYSENAEEAEGEHSNILKSG